MITVASAYYYYYICFVVDCGAGIGRVSKRLLLPLFNTVDMEEQNPAFLKKAEEYLVSRLVVWLIGWLFGWLVGWLVGLIVIRNKE